MYFFDLHWNNFENVQVHCKITFKIILQNNLKLLKKFKIYFLIGINSYKEVFNS